jgi:FlaA1/EpsC-like NDP-sugar epimerase
MRPGISASTVPSHLFQTRNNRRGHSIYTFDVTPSLQDLDWCAFLARPTLPSPSHEDLEALRQQPILITGAGGSIGSALALRMCALAPPKLILLEASENNLYNIERQCVAAAGANSSVACQTTPILGSTADRALLDEIFSTHAPGIVFHAAAFKHVPLMEEQPLAAIQNNIFATETLVRAAAAHGARVVLLSTDKAVEPASVMGATKRVAEQIVLAHGGSVLRLGNVLASCGSVVEVFARQIAFGGPLTVTNPTARRYFLTVDEAVNLLLWAAATQPGVPSFPVIMSEAPGAPSIRAFGEWVENDNNSSQPLLHNPSALLAPALLSSHLVLGLARFIAGALAPDREIAIDFIGLRPGDKENERLWAAGESTGPVDRSGMVRIEAAQPEAANLNRGLASLRAAIDTRDLPAAIAQLCAMVPDYTPSRTVLTLAGRHDSQICAPLVCV